MEHRLFIVFVVVAVVVLLTRALAGRFSVPDTIVLVLLGMAAGFIPGLPAVVVPSQLVLMGFLPPLLYHAAFFTAPREARADIVPIFALAFGLTAVTTVAVGGTINALVPGIGWAAALAFGAAVSPTDPVAATSVMQRLGAPPRMATILEGESLINDGVALTVFSLATEALTTRYTFAHGVWRVVQVVVGGIAYGFVLGIVVRRIRRWVRDPVSQVIVSLVTPYAAFIPAESFGASGVLATVTAGLWIGTRGEGVLQPASRLIGNAFWNVLTFLLESALFVLLGLEIRQVLREPGGHTWGEVAVATAAVSAVVIGLRLLWELASGPLSRVMPGGRRLRGLGRRQRFVIGLGGMRGAISMAIALSMPAAVGAERGVLVLLAALVVLVTLVGQAPLLPMLLRVLGLAESDRGRIESMTARKAGIEAALARLDELAENDEVEEDTEAAFRQMLELRLERVRYFLDKEEDREERHAPPSSRRIRGELVKAQRRKLTSLYRKGRIGADTLRAISRELDFEDPTVLRRS